MHLYLVALLVFGAGMVFTGFNAALACVATPHKRRNQRLNFYGAFFAGLGCAVGLCGIFEAPFASVSDLEFPWGLPFGSFRLSLDALGRLFLLPVFGLGLICAFSGQMALRHERASEHNLAAHWFFYLMLLTGMTLVLCARDMILFLLAWEVMSLAPFFLVDFNDLDRKVREAAWTYLVAAHLGAVFLIAFFVLLWQVSGTTALQPVQTLLADSPWLSGTLFWLGLLGFGAKAGVAPLHVWLPDAHPAAPSHVSALMSGAMINLGLYGVIRTIWLLATPHIPSTGFTIPQWWGWVLLLAGVGSAFFAVLKGLGQANLKRLLAYSSVENMGLMLAGLGVSVVGMGFGQNWVAFLGAAACLLHMLNHAWFKGLLFLCAGEILHAVGTIRLSLLGGLQQKLPLLGILFAIGAAAIACLPPFSGFTGEFLLAVGMASANGGVEQEGLLLSLALVALISGLAAALYIKAYGLIFSGSPRSIFAANPAPCGLPLLWPLCIAATVVVAGGLFAPVFFSAASDAALVVLPSAPLPEYQVIRDAASGWMFRIACSGWGVCAGVGLLYFLRKRLVGRRLSRQATWGCGYQASSARIQYTAGSFSEPLWRVFAPLIGVKIHEERPGGIFPGPASLGISAPDRVRNKFFVPLFEGFARLANACKIIQHGRIHLYILYILATLITLLLWGLWP